MIKAMISSLMWVATPLHNDQPKSLNQINCTESKLNLNQIIGKSQITYKFNQDKFLNLIHGVFDVDPLKLQREKQCALWRSVLKN